MKKSIYIYFIIIVFLPGIAHSAELSLFPDTYKQYTYREGDLLIASNTESEDDKDGFPGSSDLSWDVLGKKGKHFHPSLTLTAVYTDNAYLSSTDEESDFSVYLSPEIWITFPRVWKRPQDIRSTSSRPPGGMALSRSSPAITRRYQAHLMYRADIPIVSENSPSGDTVRQKFGGGISYKANRFMLDVVDRYMIAYEERGTGVSTEPSDVDDYNSNYLQTILTFDTRHRIRLRFDYSNYWIDYDDDRNSFRERTDNSYSTYVYYKLRPKTAAFVQYTFIDVQYDKNSLRDSDEHNFFGGVQWDVTAKTKGLFKAGYGIKEFENTDEEDTNFILETQVHYKFTPKTSLRVSAFRKTNETDLRGTTYIVSNGIEGEYQQMLTSKITGLARLSYVNDDYKDEFPFLGVLQTREDDTVQASLGLQHQFRRWLQGSVGYVYTERDSNIDYFDYTSNTVFLRVTGSM